MVADQNSQKHELVIGGHFITIEDIWNLSHREVNVQLNAESDFIQRINRGPEVVKQLIDNGAVVYGVNTGLGDSCTVPISEELIAEFPANVITFLGVGLGDYFNEEQTRAILAARLISLSRGFSGVRLELLQQLTSLIKWDILPRIPQEGSVGASGDLAPLSYVGAVMCGYRDVKFRNQILPAVEVLAKVGMSPLKLIPKEGLALVNGTSVMTGIACLAWMRAERLCQLATRLTSLVIVGVKGNLFHYDKTLFSVKPHPGQQKVATRIREDLLIPDIPQDYAEVDRIEDRYSTRCAPHVIGVLEDALPFFRQLIQNELNSANDNPIVDIETERVFHGSMFYGGHIAFAMDGMKILVASIADLMERQMALLVDPAYNFGLPANLSGMKGPSRAIHHGLKGLQIAASAWTAEALKQTMPASSFSRSTECHNQDKVSMGTIGARDCLRILQLTEQVAAALLIAVRQALPLRREIEPEPPLDSVNLSKPVEKFMQLINEEIEFIAEDVYLEPVLRRVVNKIQQGVWFLY